MGKNQLAVSGKKKPFVDVTSILNSESNKAKLQNYVDEVIRCKTKILDENESIKGLRDAAVEELNIEPKMFNAIVSLHFNNNFDEKLAEIEQLEMVISALMQTNK